MKLPVRRVRLVTLAIAAIATAALPLLSLGSGSQPARATSGTLEVWWPSASVSISGTQPFKALLTDRRLNQYHMYWQVDGGPLHQMTDSYEDHPHKEAVVDLSKWPGDGSYDLNFVATAKSGKQLAERSVTITVTQTEASADPPATTTSTPSKTTTTSSTTTTVLATTTTVLATTTTTSATTTTAESKASGLRGATLYVDPFSPAKTEADVLRDSHPYEASLLDKISGQSAAKWFGDWNGDIFAAVDQATSTITAAGALPVYVVYNIPLRDCSSYSAGGAQSADEYRSWIEAFAEGIGGRPAAIILEPDALALLDCLSDELRAERVNLLDHAVEALGVGGSISVYLDAGHARWHSPEETARRLQSAGIAKARGFALNVSNFVGADETVAYGQKVSKLLGGTPFVVDSSRNGLGPAPDEEWCNPSGRALGLPPTTDTGLSAVDAFLWVKPPGESDGTCNGGPQAGHFWTEYALGLAERADW
jgi:endoglucanase